MPPWSHVHPLVVHFPIALLLVSPLPVLLGLLWPGQRRGIHATALGLLTLGTVAALAALVTGEAASGLAQGTPELRLALLAHEALAQRAAVLFVVLTLAFAVIHLAAPARFRLFCLLWLALCVPALAVLARAAHLGGTLVHVLGTHGPARPAPRN